MICGFITSSLEVVLHLTELGHDRDGLSLAGYLLDLGVLHRLLESSLRHKIRRLRQLTSTRINTLCFCHAVSEPPYVNFAGVICYLFVANGKFTRGDLVILRKALELHNRVALQDRRGKLDVCLGVFVTGLLYVSFTPLYSYCVHVRKRPSRRAEQRGAYSGPRAFLPHFLQRICHILLWDNQYMYATYQAQLPYRQ